MSRRKKNKTNKDGFRILHLPTDRYKVQYLEERCCDFFTVTGKYKNINDALQESSILLKSLEAPVLSEEESVAFEDKLDIFFENVCDAGFKDEPNDEDGDEIDPNMIFYTLYEKKFVSKGIIFLEPPDKLDSENRNFFSFASDAGLFVAETKCKNPTHAIFLNKSIYNRILETPITQQYPIVEFNIKTAF